MHVSTDICADPWLPQERSLDDKTVSDNLEAPQASRLSKIIFENAACTRSVGAANHPTLGTASNKQ